jgi:hypothetical protein
MKPKKQSVQHAKTFARGGDDDRMFGKQSAGPDRPGNTGKDQTAAPGEARRNLDAAVERAIPSYREVDRDPQWHRWLLGIDTYTGQPRQALLNIAIMDGSASRVVALFRGFQAEAGVDSAQPSSTRGHRSSGRQIYTRDQIKQLYRAHQQGAYAGREQEWARQEADIIRASGEGRIVGGVDVAGK